ncbi:hypothetical protein DRO64_08005 [Candidatus Bathyarchaeota archaeon]|nr:MAG: hypothetical protein DRO64_08005 [Candidatus Bathyarchaeota archaeon]
MIVGLDVGAYLTKGVLMENNRIIKKSLILTDEKAESALKTLKVLLDERLDSVRAVGISGGGSRKVKRDLLGLPTVKVNEIQAIGLGGLMLSKREEALIVNAGTGTAIVAAYEAGKRIIHVGGTGVGGGTLLGLSMRMLGSCDFPEIEKLAINGDPGKVDLRVSDIVGGSIGIVPSEATASNFGRIKAEASREDVAAGIFNMVCQVIGVVGAMAAKAYGLSNSVVVTGGLTRSKLASEIIWDAMRLFGIEPLIPENGEYCTAIGAARFLLKR